MQTRLARRADHRCQAAGGRRHGGRLGRGVGAHCLGAGAAIGLFLVDLAGPGVERHALQSVDPTRPQARIAFSAAPALLLGRTEDGAAALRRTLDRAAVLVAFEQIGGADAALAMSVEYAKIRHAFGRPIGSFQAIKHKLADMYTRNQLARSNAWYAAWALDASAEELPLAASAARIAASEAFEFAAKENDPDPRRHRRHLGGRHASVLPARERR